MTHTKDEAKAATPHHDLIAELLNPNTPKTEREHAASREIERLQALEAPVSMTSESAQGVEQDERVFARIAAMKKPPAAQPAVPLTDDEVERAIDQIDQNTIHWMQELFKFARAIEAKLREKNGAAAPEKGGA
jgi:hypothetical protein